MLISHFLVKIVPVGILLLAATGVYGQDYPNKPIRIITAGAGGGADFTARQVAKGISGPLGQPVVVDNRTGLLAADAVSKALPDGYTLLIAGGSIWITPLLQKAPYSIGDFAPISLVERGILIIAVHPSVPVLSIKELIALAKAKPGELNYASGNTGAPTHLATELFKSMAGVNMVRIPYKGNAPTMTALISGEAQLLILDAGLLTPHAKSGKLRALAITSAERSALVPGLPTVAASGLPGYESVNMTGFFAPAKTPGAIINRLNQDVVRILTLPEVKERFLDAALEIVGNTPAQFAAAIKSDMAKMEKVIKDAGIKVD